MITIFLTYLVPLYLVYTGFWDVREIVVLFWMECLIAIIYSTYRGFMMIGEKFWRKFFLLIVWTVFLIYIWRQLGAAFYHYMFLSKADRVEPRILEYIGNLLVYSVSNYGWVAVIVLFVIHGAKEVKRYNWSDGYRNVPIEMRMNTVKYLMGFYLITYFTSIAVVFYSPDSAVVVTVMVIMRMAIESKLQESELPCSDLSSEVGKQTTTEVPKELSGKTGRFIPFLLGLLFILVGSYMGFIIEHDDGGQEQYWLVTLIGWLFLLGGIMFWVLPFLIRRNTGVVVKDTSVVLTQDQTHRVIKPDVRTSTLIVLWMVTIIFGVLAVIYWKGMLSLEQTDWGIVAVTAFLSAILLLLFYASVHTTLGMLRFGSTPLLLPVQQSGVERQFRARMQIKHADIVKKVSARLVCYRLIWEQKEKAKGRLQLVLSRTKHWEISNNRFRANRDGTVEIVFKLPPEMPGTSGSFEMAYREADFGKPLYAWELDVEAEVHGTDLLRSYEVPVTSA